MKNRREFLGVCAAAATVMAMPAAGQILAATAAIDGPDAFRSLEGQWVTLREGGSVLVVSVDAVEADPRWEQSLVQVVPCSEMESGIYHLQTAAGSRALYLEAGGSVRRPTLTAAFSRLRA